MWTRTAYLEKRKTKPGEGTLYLETPSCNVRTQRMFKGRVHEATEKDVQLCFRIRGLTIPHEDSAQDRGS